VQRGIRTFETYTRNTFDIAAIPLSKKLSHLRCLRSVDGTGRRDKVPPMAAPPVAAAADGLLIEVTTIRTTPLDGAHLSSPANSRSSWANSHHRPGHRRPYHLTMQAGHLHFARHHFGTGLIGGSFLWRSANTPPGCAICGWTGADVFARRKLARDRRNLLRRGGACSAKTPI